MSEKTAVNSILTVAPTTEDLAPLAAIRDMFELGPSRVAVERAMRRDAGVQFQRRTGG